jgi:hypothetical protein
VAVGSNVADNASHGNSDVCILILLSDPASHSSSLRQKAVVVEVKGRGKGKGKTS